MPLGNTGTILTFLTLEDPGRLIPKLRRGNQPVNHVRSKAGLLADLDFPNLNAPCPPECSPSVERSGRATKQVANFFLGQQSHDSLSRVIQSAETVDATAKFLSLCFGCSIWCDLGKKISKILKILA